jgi:hypothetical protein
MIYCTNCGKELPDDSSFCNACGKPVLRDADPNMFSYNEPYMQSAAQNSYTDPNEQKPYVNASSQNPYSSTPTSGYGYGQPDAGDESKTLAIIALIAAVLFSPIGIVLGLIGLNSYKNPSNRQWCKIAIGISIGLILFSILMVGFAYFSVSYVVHSLCYYGA